MTLIQRLFETGPEGTAMTLANSGATTVSPTSGANAPQFAASAKVHGSYGFSATNAVNAQSVARYPFNAANNAVQTSMWIQIPAANPANLVTVMSYRHSAGTCATLQLQSGLFLYDQPGTLIGTVLSSGNATPSTWFRITAVITGGTTTAGAMTFKVYNGAGTQVGSTLTTSVANLTANTIAAVDIGVVSANNAAGQIIRIDDLQMNDGTGTEIADYVPPTTALSWTHTVTPTSGTGPFDVTVVITASGGTGTAYVYTFDFGDGTVTTQGTNTLTHTYAAVSTQTVRTGSTLVANS